MAKIIPCLWFDTQAHEAAQFYVSVFPGSRILSSYKIDDTPSGQVQIVDLTILGLDFEFMSAGPYFKMNPSISFLVLCKKEEIVRKLWQALLPDCKILMEFSTYDFSPLYGWLNDRFGVSWQIMLDPSASGNDHIVPTLMFTHASCGQAEDAMENFTSLMGGYIEPGFMRWPEGSLPDKPGTIMYGEFTVHGVRFAAMDSAFEHGFGFNEAVSILISCKDQSELDRYWKALSVDPDSEQCGWLKDKYGISWQIVPEIYFDMVRSGDTVKINKLFQAILKMKKLDIAAIKTAYEAT